MMTKSRVCVDRKLTRGKARITKINHLWPPSRRLKPGSTTEAELVDKYIPLVRTVVSRLALTLPPHVDSEDLYSAGLGGLLSAIRQYDPTAGTAFLSVRDADKEAVLPVAAALAGLGFELVATEGTGRVLAAADLEVKEVAKGKAVVDLIRKGRCDLVVNTPEGSNARQDGYRIREAALVARVPCITTISGAAAAVHAIANARSEIAQSLQERIGLAEARTA